MPAVPQLAERSRAHWIGQVRRFGRDGVLYEILGFLGTGDVKIRVLDTGEVLNYPVAAVEDDPQS